MIGRVVSHYEIVEPLGAGGMGVVYRGERLELGRLQHRHGRARARPRHHLDRVQLPQLAVVEGLVGVGVHWLVRMVAFGIVTLGVRWVRGGVLDPVQDWQAVGPQGGLGDAGVLPHWEYDSLLHVLWYICGQYCV